MLPGIDHANASPCYGPRRRARPLRKSTRTHVQAGGRPFPALGASLRRARDGRFEADRLSPARREQVSLDDLGRHLRVRLRLAGQDLALFDQAGADEAVDVEVREPLADLLGCFPQQTEELEHVAITVVEGQV